MERITESLTLLLSDKQRPLKTLMPSLEIMKQVSELLKNEAAVYCSTILTKEQAAMRMRLLSRLADQYGLNLFQEAFENCLLEYEFPAEPGQVKKEILLVKEDRAQKRLAAQRQPGPRFRQLPGCPNECGKEGGI